MAIDEQRPGPAPAAAGDLTRLRVTGRTDRQRDLGAAAGRVQARVCGGGKAGSAEAESGQIFGRSQRWNQGRI